MRWWGIPLCQGQGGEGNELFLNLGQREFVLSYLVLIFYSISIISVFYLKLPETFFQKGRIYIY